MRRLVGFLGVLAAAALSSGCGSGSFPDVPATPAGGSAAVPVDPQRVVVLDADVTLEPVLALGLPVVAAPRPSATGGFPPAVEALLPEDFTDLGSVTSLSGEAVAAVDPDVIVINPENPGVVDRYDDLLEIAPVVAPAYEQFEWRQRLQETAAVFGLDAEAAEVLARHDERVAEVAELVPDGTTLSMARVRQDGLRYLTSGGAYPWTVLSDLGFVQPDVQEQGEPGSPFVDISLEEADLLAADIRVVAVDGGVDGDTGAQVLADLEANPLWVDLSGDVEIVASDGWIFGSVLSAGEILDDVAEWYG